MYMNKIAVIIGGTFNPITKAHLNMGILVKEILPNADIWYVPTNLKFISKWKEIDLSNLANDYDNRIQVIINVLGEYNFLYSLHEVNNTNEATTYDTIEYFKDMGYNEIYLCLGFDKINEIQYWAHAKELMDEVNLILFSRDCQGKKNILNAFILQYIDKITEIEMPEKYQHMSSTKVREAYNDNRLDDVKDMLPDIVYKVLKEKINV